MIHRQIREIRIGGLHVLLRKVSLALMVPVSFPIVIVVRVLRPLVLIRFGLLMSPRLGNFAARTELYLCERDVGMHRGRTLDIFFLYPQVCNRFLRKKWEKMLHISALARPLWEVNRRLPGGESHIVPMPRDTDIYGLFARTPVHVSFTPEEESLGRTALQELGIPEGSPFVCFYARDSAYLDTVYQADWSYQDFRDASIHNYVPAAGELACRGYFAIRMGAVVKEALNTANPRIIDYATKARTDFLDIFLCARCRFFLGSSAGLSAVPRIFRRPIVLVNYVPLRPRSLVIGVPGSLFIPKKLWLSDERRFLTFREIRESGVSEFVISEQYEQLGIEVTENTPEEITAVVMEMDERLKGTWQTTEEDEELQRQFWSLVKPSKLNGALLPRIGTEFLRQNHELLA